MPKSKKAVIEIQFNWIFILIAGAIILVFFATIITKQKGAAETRTNVVVVRALESILTGAKVSKEAATDVTLPIGDIKFACDSYSVGNVPRKLKQMTVFTPDFIKGKQIVAWSYPWDVPFRVTNFLYLTSPQVRYIFVNANEGFGNEIYTMLPGKPGLKPTDKKMFRQTDTELTSSSGWTLDDLNNYKVKFVYFADYTDGNSLTYTTNSLNNEDKDITAIKIVPDQAAGSGDNDWSKGNILFYKKSSNSWQLEGTLRYYQTATLLAAIFVEDRETYQCVMKKEMEKLNRVSEVLKKRSQGLITIYSSRDDTTCVKYHSKAVYGTDDPPQSLPADGSENGPLGGNSMAGASFSDMSNLHGWASSLESQNKDAESKSCALIY